MEVSQEILDFLTGVHGDRKNQKEHKKKIFDLAFALAYKDMATHTVAYKKEAKEKYVNDDSKRCNENKIKIRNAIKEFVMENFFGVANLSELEHFDLQIKRIDSQEAFNKWHKSACKSFVEIDCCVKDLKQKGEDSTVSKHICDLLCHTDGNLKYDGVFTYGQAQKFINMMLKYLYIFYKCEGWNDLDNLEKYAHVPIDSYVLNEVFGKEAYNGTPWSKIRSYDEYMRCKEEINKKAKANGSPFMWELANWPFNSKK